MADIYRVFLSSTADDLEEHRARVLGALGRLDGVKAVHQERMGARGRRTVEECTRLARNSDILVVVVAHRYGWVPSRDEGGDGVRSITWLEVDAALSEQRPVLAFLVDVDHPWAAPKEQDQLLSADGEEATRRVAERVRSLRDFRRHLEKLPRELFREPADLAAGVATAVSNEIGLLESGHGAEQRATARDVLSAAVVGQRPASARWTLDIGATVDPDGTRFTVWSPTAAAMDVLVYSDAGDEVTAIHPLGRDPARSEYFTTHLDGVVAGALYKYRIDGLDAFPDPASRHQPLGVHGPSEVVDPNFFAWTDSTWHGVDFGQLVMYQVHVGTATREGTFDALISRLGAIRELGATALLLMPVADFSGERNWGYDGVHLFAPARSYGGPEGLRRLVDAAHARDLGVIVDVVFNHLGPEGNYLRKFSERYFSDPDVHTTPWGDALSFEGRSSRPVRAFFVANACHWAHEFHADGLRFDTISAIRDNSELYIVEEICSQTIATLPPERSFLTIAEDDHNDGNIVRRQESGGLGLDAVYADDFHHQVMVAMTNQRSGYYGDYAGTTEEIVRTINDGWFFTGQMSGWRDEHVGSVVNDIAAEHFVYCLDNHDQVGNRPAGERLCHLVDLPTYHAASTLLLGLPFTPLLFMGQEWAASSPFLYFTDFSDELGAQVAVGRARRLGELFPAHAGTLSDPQQLDTFLRSKVRWEERTMPGHSGTLALYEELLRLRRRKRAVYNGARGTWRAAAVDERALAVRLRDQSDVESLLVVVSLIGGSQVDLGALELADHPEGRSWRVLIDTRDVRFGGTAVDPTTDAEAFDLTIPRGLIFELA